MGISSIRWWVASALAITALQAAALSPGMADTFESGADGGWSAGPASVAPPSVVSSGGPSGAGDGYLVLTALGGAGASSRLTAIAGPQWAGDYLSAGVDRISMDLKNLGSSTLNLRLWLAGPLGASALSFEAVTLATGSNWTAISFSLAPGALSGQALAVLADVQQLRLFHGTSAGFPGEPIVAALGVDNVSAVPEPATAWLLLAGLATAGALRRRRPGCSSPPLAHGPHFASRRP